MSYLRIGRNDDGSLDEFVAHDVAVHFEAMDTMSAPTKLLALACPTCDGTPPVAEEPPLPPLEALARNPLRRMLDAALNRRSS